MALALVVIATRAESLCTSEERMPINEARQFGWATACVLSAESSIRDKLLCFDKTADISYYNEIKFLIMIKKSWAKPVLKVIELEKTKSGLNGNNEAPNNTQAKKFADAGTSPV